MSRRAVLRGAVRGGLVSLALPPLEAMLNAHGTADAADNPLPLRFGVWMWGNGVRLREYLPSTTGADWALTPSTMPLANVKSKLSLVSGLQVKLKGEVHHVGKAAMITGAPYQMASQATAFTDSTAGGPSIDVEVAKAWGAIARPVHVGVAKVKGAVAIDRDLSYNGPSSPNPAEYDPAALYQHFFGGSVAGNPTDAAARAAVLDAVVADAKTLCTRISKSDCDRITQHLDGLRDIQVRLRGGGASTGSIAGCGAVERPGAFPDDQALQEKNHVMANILVMAMVCDLTRVFTFHFTPWIGPVFPEIGATIDFHTLTHTEANPQQQVQNGVVLSMKALAYLLERLQSAVEGDGSVLDRCAILATSEVAEGKDHGLFDLPVIVAGRAGGKLRAGLHHRSPNAESTSAVHLTLLNALGIPRAQYGAGDGLTTTRLGALEI